MTRNKMLDDGACIEEIYRDNDKSISQQNYCSIVKNRLLDIHAGSNRPVNNSWSEGYLSALADIEKISEEEFEELLNWLKGRE